MSERPGLEYGAADSGNTKLRGLRRTMLFVVIGGAVTVGAVAGAVIGLERVPHTGGEDGALPPELIGKITDNSDPAKWTVAGAYAFVGAASALVLLVFPLATWTLFTLRKDVYAARRQSQIQLSREMEAIVNASRQQNGRSPP